MSRRCRASLVARGSGGLSGGAEGLDSGCDCGRLGGSGKAPEICANFFSPGFYTLDQHVARYGRGATNVELPRRALALFDDGSEAGYPAYATLNNTPTYADAAYIIEVVDTDPPGSNTYHLFVQGGIFSGGSDLIAQLVTGRACFSGVPSSLTAYTSEARNGDLVEVRFQHKRTAQAGSFFRTRVYVAVVDDSTIYTPGSLQFLKTCTTSYTNELVSVFLNEPTIDVKAVAIRFQVNFSTLQASWYCGDISINVVKASATGIILCSQSSLITIDNSTTETAFL